MLIKICKALEEQFCIIGTVLLDRITLRNMQLTFIGTKDVVLI